MIARKAEILVKTTKEEQPKLEGVDVGCAGAASARPGAIRYSSKWLLGPFRHRGVHFAAKTI